MEIILTHTDVSTHAHVLIQVYVLIHADYIHQYISIKSCRLYSPIEMYQLVKIVDCIKSYVCINSWRLYSPIEMY